MSDSPKVLYLPETMANWPWPRLINPHYEEVAAQSRDWFRGFNVFNKRSQQAFDRCDFGRLASLAFPSSSKEHLRTGCDLMNIFFAIDEFTDVENASGVREIVDIVIDALNNPHKPRPKDEVLLGEIARQFWELAIKAATPTSQRHFIESFSAYLNSLVDEAVDRDNDRIRSIDSYIKARRENIGARPFFMPIELGLNLPDEVFYHPIIVELSYYIADLLLLDHDIASYNKEQASGEDRYNILTVAMHELNTDLEGAMAWVVKYHAEVEAKFIDGLTRIPQFGPAVDKQLEVYMLGLARCPRGNDCWNFESGRYFGTKGLEIQVSRRVPLLPKSNVKNDPTRKREVAVPLIEL